MGKGRASFKHAIEIWGENLGIIQRVYGPETLVIGDQDKEIWFPGR